jgi:hypothetical protein
MTGKVYRTAQGKMIDLGALILQNENTRAVGNMGVNARGDRVNTQNETIDSRNQQVARQYNRQVSPVIDEPVAESSSKKSSVASRAPVADDTVNDAPAEQVVEQQASSPDPVEINLDPDTGGGLAAAIAKARQIKQEPLKTPRQVAQDKPGVNKI